MVFIKFIHHWKKHIEIESKMEWMVLKVKYLNRLVSCYAALKLIILSLSNSIDRIEGNKHWKKKFISLTRVGPGHLGLEV